MLPLDMRSKALARLCRPIAGGLFASLIVFGLTPFAFGQDEPSGDPGDPEVAVEESKGEEAPTDQDPKDPESTEGESSAEEQVTRLAIRAARVIVRPGKVLENAIVLVEDGTISEVGVDVEIPEGVEVLEGEVVLSLIHI